MSFGDDIAEHDSVPPPSVLAPEERALLAKPQWSMDELIRIAFLARRLVAHLEAP